MMNLKNCVGKHGETKVNILFEKIDFKKEAKGKFAFVLKTGKVDT